MNASSAMSAASTGFKAKTIPITDEYYIGKNVLGLGISGKVVECFNIKTNEKFALKVCDLYLIYFIFLFIYY